MSRYEEIKEEIFITKERIREANEEIQGIKWWIQDLYDSLDELHGPPRQEILVEIRYHKDLLDGWYFDKSVFKEKLDELYDEKTSLERQKECRSCHRYFTYCIEWTHIPNYCPECKGQFKRKQSHSS